MNDEEGNDFVRDVSNYSNSDSISALNDNASTYMGVKTIPEGTIPDNNETREKTKKNKKKKKKKEKKIKKKKKRDNSSSSSSSSYYSSSSNSSSSSSSYSSSSNSSSSSESEYSSNKNKKSFTDLINKKKEEQKEEKEKEEKEKEVKGKDEKQNNEKEKEEKYKEREKKNEKEEVEKIDEIETKFEWDEGGNSVYLTGSFCEWKQFFLMKKNEEGKHTITLFLPRGFHQYKFKVDDNWTYSKKQPKFEDNGNVNNFIDTTDYENLNEENNEEKNNIKEEESLIKENDEKEKEIEKEIQIQKEKIEEIKEEKIKEIENKKNKTKLIDNDEEEKELEKNYKINTKKRNSTINNVHFLNSQNQYSIYYPLRAEFSKRPSALPGLFKTYYILNEKKNKKIQERKFSQIEYVDSSNNSIQESHSESQSQSLNQSINNSLYFTNDVNPYVKFQNLYHIHSNHLHSKEAIHTQNTITSIISRYRFKFSTFIYYKENKPKVFENNMVKHSGTVRIKRGGINKNIKK